MSQSISSKIFENSEVDVDNFNKYDFFKFDNVSDIEFFKSIDWIIDYNSVLNDIIDFKSGLLKMTLPNKENKLQKLIIGIFIKRKN